MSYLVATSPLTNEQIYANIRPVKRKVGALLPIELDILEACAALAHAGSPECHGFLIASLIKGRKDARLLTAYGTLYRALNRLETAGLLTSRWEDLSSLAEESRPRRRLYRLTEAGAQALANGLKAAAPAPVARMQVSRLPREAEA